MPTENNVAAQAGDEPVPCPFCGFDESSVESYSVQPDSFHSAYVQCDQCDSRGPNALTVDGWLPSKEEAIAEAIKAWNSQVSPRATADVEREKLPHGHREDFYLMANARRIAMEPIDVIKRTPNWVLAMGLFATGSTSAHEICTCAGIDPDGYKVERATTKPGA